MAAYTKLCSDGTKAHHWVIGCDFIGHCTKHNCDATKDFSEKKRGRPCKSKDWVGKLGQYESAEPQRFHAHGPTDGFYLRLLELMENCPSELRLDCLTCPHKKRCLSWWDGITSYTVNHVIDNNKYQTLKSDFLELRRNGRKPIH